MSDPSAPRRNPSRSPTTAPPAPAGSWLRQHLVVVIGVGAAVLIVIVGAAVLALGSGSGGSQSVSPGSYVGTDPLTSGYRVAGTVKARTATSVTVQISRVDASAGEARNVVLRPGATIEFDKPVDGPVNLARNGRRIPTPLKLHTGDSLVLEGEFTDVVRPSGPAHQGYAYIGVEASS